MREELREEEKQRERTSEPEFQPGRQQSSWLDVTREAHEDGGGSLDESCCASSWEFPLGSCLRDDLNHFFRDDLNHFFTARFRCQAIPLI